MTPLSKRFEIEIQIVDHCNLKCDNCNHFANLAKEWYMSIEEFTFNVNKIKTELYPYGLTRIMLVGGEPLLHPQIIDLCKILRTASPKGDVDLSLLTNGILLNDTTKIIEKYVGVTATPYPDITSISSPHSYMHSRLFFLNNPVDSSGKSSSNITDCQKYNLPCFFVRDYKMFMCPFSGCIHIYNEHFNQNIQYVDGDYIPMEELTIDKIKTFMDNGPTQICKYCEHQCQIFYWNRCQFYSEYDYGAIDLEDLYVNHYEQYDILVNGKNLLKNFKYWGGIDEQYGSKKLHKELNRINGKLDIIIPFYNCTQEQMHKLLTSFTKQKDCEYYHIYLVSDCSPYEREIFRHSLDFDSQLNITMLKTNKRSGPGAARQVGLDNSYNQYVFFMDCDDDIINYNFFFDALQLFQESKCDIVCGNTKINSPDNYDWLSRDDIFKNDSHCLVYSREFIKDCKFLPIFISEDADWCWQVMNKHPKVQYIDTPTYIYNKGNVGSIGSSSTVIDQLLYRMYIDSRLPSYYTIEGCLNDILNADNLVDKWEQLPNSLVQDIVLISFYFGYTTYYKLSPQQQVEFQSSLNDVDSFSSILRNKIIAKDMLMYSGSKVYATPQDYEALIKSYISNSVYADNLKECFYEICG